MGSFCLTDRTDFSFSLHTSNAALKCPSCASATLQSSPSEIPDCAIPLGTMTCGFTLSQRVVPAVRIVLQEKGTVQVLLLVQLSSSCLREACSIFGNKDCQVSTRKSLMLLCQHKVIACHLFIYKQSWGAALVYQPFLFSTDTFFAH